MADEKSEQICNEMEVLSVTDGDCMGLPKKPKELTARMVTHRDDPDYKMNHKRRGLAVIFAHKQFDQLGPRNETDIDVKNLNEVLTKLDFKPEVYEDLYHKQIMKEITKMVQTDHTDHDCILIVILSHGDSDLVSARDKYYKLDDIWSAFSADKCPTLAGKPKLFFVETSPGKARDIGFRMQSQQNTIQTDSSMHCEYKIPIYADFLLAFSTIPTFCSWSDSLTGSWYVQSLCDELNQSGKSLDLLMLLTFVAQRVAVNFETQTGYKQVTCTMSTLTRNCRFADQKRTLS